METPYVTAEQMSEARGWLHDIGISPRGMSEADVVSRINGMYDGGFRQFCRDTRALAEPPVRKRGTPRAPVDELSDGNPLEDRTMRYTGFDADPSGWTDHRTFVARPVMKTGRSPAYMPPGATRMPVPGNKIR